MATDNVTPVTPASPAQADLTVFKALLSLVDRHRTELLNVLGTLSCVVTVVDEIESVEEDAPHPSFALRHAYKTLDRIAAELEEDPLIQSAGQAVAERDREGEIAKR
jgi:hypothetical protein